MKLIRPIISIFLAGLVTISSVGVTVNQHICMGQIRSTALFVKAKSCGMSESNERMSLLMKGKGCCDEKSILISTKEKNAEAGITFLIAPSYHLVAVILPIVCRLLDARSEITQAQYAHYKPPLMDRDITVLVHSLLI